MFKHRKLVVLSEDNINSFECGAFSQAFFIACLAAVIGWGCFASYYVLKTEVKLAGALDDEEVLRLKYIRIKAQEKDASKDLAEFKKSNASLKSEIASLKYNMRDVTGLLDNLGDLTEARGAEFCETVMQSSTPVPVTILKGGHDDAVIDISKTLSGLEERVDARIGSIHQALSELPKNARPLLAKTPRQMTKNDALSESEGGQGGPFIPESADTPAAARTAPDVSFLKIKISHLAALERNLRGVPLAVPYGEYRVTSGFGSRTDPITKRRSGHFGIDLNAGHKAEVSASADGTVLRAGRVGAYGNLVEIQHKNGFTTRYAHLHKTNVKAGQKVRQGDVVGLQGNTGRSTGSHLHYEVRYRNTPINPKHFLKAASHVF